MGKINKFCNLYNKDGKLIKSVSEDGRLKDFSVKELEELVDSLPEGQQKINAFNHLYNLYLNPKTKEDREYVEMLQKKLIAQFENKQKSTTKAEDVRNAIESINDEKTRTYDVNNNEDSYVEPISENDDTRKP